VTLVPRRLTRLLFLWLALATVIASALDPVVGSPLAESHGSAFNAFTSDVSLGPSRATAPERERKYLGRPAAGSGQPGAGTAIAAPQPPFRLAPPPAPAVLAVAPPPEGHAFRLAARASRARAPPFA
jgi:hypothetical protein